MLENLKKSVLEKIQKNCIVSEINGEKIYLSKGSIFSWLPIKGKWFKEWGQIYPAINEDESINWVNLIFGGWRNLWKLVFIMALAGMIVFQFYQNFQYIEALKEIPCVKSCLEVMQSTPNPLIDLKP